MDWQNFLKQLITDFRTSVPKLAALTGLSTTALYKIKKGGTEGPNQGTLALIEKALNIKISDDVNGNVTYQKLPPLIKEDRGEYKVAEIISKQDLDMIKKLKEMGIDSVEKLEKFYDYEGIAEDIKEVLKKKLYRS